MKKTITIGTLAVLLVAMSFGVSAEQIEYSVSDDTYLEFSNDSVEDSINGDLDYLIIGNQYAGGFLGLVDIPVKKETILRN